MVRVGSVIDSDGEVYEAAKVSDVVSCCSGALVVSVFCVLPCFGFV